MKRKHVLLLAAFCCLATSLVVQNLSSVSVFPSWGIILLCIISFLSGGLIVLFQTKNKSQSFVILHLFGLGTLVLALSVLVGIVIFLFLVFTPLSFFDAFTISFMIGFALVFFLGTFHLLGTQSAIISILGGMSMGWLFGIGVASGNWEALLLSGVLIALGSFFGILYKRSCLRNVLK